MHQKLMQQLLKSFNKELNPWNESEKAPIGLEIVLDLIESQTHKTMQGIRAFYQMTHTRSNVSNKNENDN